MHGIPDGEAALSDLTPLDFLVVGNGATVYSFEWSRIDPNLRIISTNGNWEQIPVEVDLIVAADEHWVKYNRENAPGIPLYTKPPWSTKWQVSEVVGSNTESLTGIMGIQLAQQFNPRYIHCIGFDVITLGTAHRFHNHPIKGSMIRRPKRFKEQYWKVYCQSPAKQIKCMITADDFSRWCYK